MLSLVNSAFKVLTSRGLQSTIGIRHASELNLLSVLAEKINKETKRIAEFRKQYGKEKMTDITIDMIYGGMRDMNGLVYETSLVDHKDGVSFRGLSITECKGKLPKVENGSQPLPEGMFYLLLTGDVPTKEQVNLLSKEWAKRAGIPKHVCTLVNSFPATLHPLSQLSCAVTALNEDSCFAKAYNEGTLRRENYWKYTFEDGMNLIAQLPVVAANIYRNVYKEGKGSMMFDPEADWAANFTTMLGFDSDNLKELMRMYLSFHSDHDGGNVATHASHLVDTALSDPYLCFSAGLNGLAGPLHGRANQEAVTWIIKMHEKLGDKPSDEHIKDYVYEKLCAAEVIPGFGHSVLRGPDPRYAYKREFAGMYLPNDSLFKLVLSLSQIVPPLLAQMGKAKNPCPNTCGISGVLFHHYGMKETSFYPVLAGVSRVLGVIASMVWARALCFPIERPKSETTEHYIRMVCDQRK